MLRQGLNARSRHLRDSYIAISNYVRSSHTRSSNQQFSCLCDRTRRPGPSTTHSNRFSNLRNLEDRSRIPHDEDITEGFPEPPESVVAPSESEGNGKALTPTPHQPSEESLPSDPGPDVPIRAVWPKNPKSAKSNKNATPALSQEDPAGTEGARYGKGGMHHLSGQYPYMGMAILNVPMFSLPNLTHSRAL